MDVGKLSHHSRRAEPRRQCVRVGQAGPAEKPSRSLQELDDEVHRLFVDGLKEDPKLRYPTRRLKAQRLYNFASLKVERDRYVAEEARAELEQKVREEEAKMVKDFNELMIAKAFRNEHDREQAALKPAVRRTEEGILAPYRENLAQTLKEQANFMRQARSADNKPYNLPEKVCTHIARMNFATTDWDKPLKDPPFRPLPSKK